MLSLEISRIGCIRTGNAGCTLIELMPAYQAGLHGLQAGDRIQVLYWMHELARADRRNLQIHPGKDPNLPRRGVFSLRSCTRPNPIGISETTIIEVREHGLVVNTLDTFDGSPLIDIKVIAS